MRHTDEVGERAAAAGGLGATPVLPPIGCPTPPELTSTSA